jgi:hypothetical protein
MDHAEASELFEIAAVEPGGLDRLMAGDTAEAAALAGHLAGCPDCAAEIGRLRDDALLIRETVRSLPPAGLRERTLASVAAIGRDRPGAELEPAAPPTAVPAAAAPPGPSAEAAPPAVTPTRRATRRVGRLAAVVAMAAALVVAVVGTAAVVNGQRDAQLAALDAELARQARAIAGLERVATWSMRIAGEPDAEQVPLAAGDGSGATGTLLFSPGTRELVVVASGLPRPAAGQEFRCWMEVGGVRRPVGRMIFADQVQYWAGPVDELADLEPGTKFGVTLVDAAGSSLDGPATLGGAL